MGNDLKTGRRRHPRRWRDPGAYRRAVSTMVARLLEERLASFAEAGHDVAELGPAEALARQMVDVVPEPSPWNEQLGPFYRSAQLARLLGGISRQALAERRKRRTLLGLKTADGMIVYPSFQLGEHREVLPGLAEVLRCFTADEVEDWAVAGWLTSPKRALDGQSPAVWLRRGRPLEPLLDLARDAGRRLAA